MIRKELTDLKNEIDYKIKTINDEWKHLKAVNFEKEYDFNQYWLEKGWLDDKRPWKK